MYIHMYVYVFNSTRISQFDIFSFSVVLIQLVLLLALLRFHIPTSLYLPYIPVQPSISPLSLKFPFHKL